jgi:hypothetical protein
MVLPHVIHAFVIVSDLCTPGCPLRFEFRLSAPMISRKVPAEYFEHLHLVNLPLAWSIRRSFTLGSAFPSLIVALPRSAKFQQVLALFLLFLHYPALPFRNLSLILFVLKMSCNLSVIISSEMTIFYTVPLRQIDMPFG